MITLYRLCDGTSEKIKVRAKAFNKNKFETGNIIKTIDCFEEKKWKFDSEKQEYYQIDERERILGKWSIVEDD